MFLCVFHVKMQLLGVNVLGKSLCDLSLILCASVVNSNLCLCVKLQL